MASIFEQYESMYQSGTVGSASGTTAVVTGVRRSRTGSGSGTKNEGIINLRSDPMEPIFAKNRIDFRPPSPVTHLVVANNQLLLSMENCHLLKIDLLNGGGKQTEIDLTPHLPKSSAAGGGNQPAVISDLFIDPSGGHCLISVCSKPATVAGKQIDPVDCVAPYENFYYHRKLTPLTRMKGHIITAVGWLPVAAGTQPGNLLVGTSDGRLFETHLQSDERFLVATREMSFWKLVCDLSTGGGTAGSTTPPVIGSDNSSSPVAVTASPSKQMNRKDPICAISCFRLRDQSGMLCVLVATRNFFYQFIGPLGPSQPGATADGTPYLFHVIQNPTIKAYKEMPGYIPSTRLDLFVPAREDFPRSFGWLTRIFYGPVPDDLGTNPDRRIFDDATVIMYNDLNGGGGNQVRLEEEVPVSAVLTRFHLLFLYPSKLTVVCVLNRQVILEDVFPSEPAVGIAKDPVMNTIWAYTRHAVYRYRVTQEDRNIWEIYLAKKDFESARKYARDDVIKMDQTICEEAMHYFALKDYKRSAQLFTQTRSKTFEEIALKFIELKDHNQEALKEFLMNKLRTLSAIKDRTQITILLLWLFEIMLNQLASLQNQIQDCASQQETLTLQRELIKIETALKDMIADTNYKAVHRRNRKIIYDLIRNHHNPEIFEYFAEQIDDFECLIEHYCQRGEYDRAIGLLRREECLDLYYRWSPVLIQHRPQMLITCLIPLASELDYAKLIPSLVHFDHSRNSDEETPRTGLVDQHRERQCQEIIRFLEYCVYDLRATNSLVHNYLLALYAQYQPDRLLAYLENVGGGGGSVEPETELVPYDIRYAARICLQCKVPPKAIIHLLTTMGAYEEAVEQALAVNDVELAKQTAQRLVHGQTDHQDMAKRLWLKIARHVIGGVYADGGGSGAADISAATSILNECPLLKIEDILPYFPEYLTIDHFKDAICRSLEEYNRHIESLREDMKQATESAEQIREEIGKLRHRYTIIDVNDPCALCSFPAIAEHFYSFPCRHLFHHRCLVDEIVEYLPMDDRIKLEALVAEAKSVQHVAKDSAANATISLANRLEQIQAKIEDLIGAECLLCGQLMIQTVDKPFIDPVRDRHELQGWN